MLFEMCQKDGHEVVIKSWRKDDRNIASVYVDGNFYVSASSDQKENAKLQAANAALEKLAHHNVKMDICADVNENSEVEADAKKKLHEVCVKKKWSKPHYRYNFFFPLKSECFNIICDVIAAKFLVLLNHITCLHASEIKIGLENLLCTLF